MPEGLRRLLHLATAVPERQGARREAIREPFLDRVGQETLGLIASVGDVLGFIGEALLALGQFLRGRARFRRVEFTMLIQECGAQALPIVTLICFWWGPSWPSSGRSNSPCSGRRSMWPIWWAWR